MKVHDTSFEVYNPASGTWGLTLPFTDTIVANDTVPSAAGCLGAVNSTWLLICERKMPSLCVKQQDKVIASEASEITLKQCLTIVEKKVRNLEKRKVSFGCLKCADC